jgi:hypothetical protein
VRLVAAGGVAAEAWAAHSGDVDRTPAGLIGEMVPNGSKIEIF